MQKHDKMVALAKEKSEEMTETQIPPADSYSLSSTEATILAGYNTSSEIGFTVTSVSEFAEGV